MSLHTPVNPFDLTSPEFIANPYPTYERLRSNTPVCWDEKLGQWLVSRYTDAHALLRDKRCSSDHLDDLMGRLCAEERAAAAPLREILTNRLLFTNNPAHRRLRMLMQLAFTPSRVELMRPIILAMANQLLDSVRDAGRMDLIADFADPLPSQVIATMLGLPQEDRQRFKAWTDDIYGFMGFSAVPVSERALRGTASARHLKAYLADLFAVVRRQPRTDLLSAMVAAEEEGERLNETELFSNVVGMINASHETTTNLIGNTVLALLQHPEQWTRLAADSGLIPGAVGEGLRYDSPVQMLQRKSVDDIQISGVTIPKGERIVVMLGAANRDPAEFPKPDTFDVTRREVKHLAFGGGPHYCLGAALGQLEGELALTAILRRLPELRLAGGALAWRQLPVFRGLQTLHVEF
jgi:cytochrome P450